MPHNHFRNNPLGNSNNSLVNSQFKPDSYDVVQTVFYNLNQLRMICEHMNMLSQLSNNMFAIQEIPRYLNDINTVAYNLKSILTISQELPFIKEVAERVTSFADNQTKLLTKINNLDHDHKEKMQDIANAQKHSNDLFIQFELGFRKKLEEAQCHLDKRALEYVNWFNQQRKEMEHKFITKFETMQQMIHEYDNNQRILAHLYASSLASDACLTGSPDIIHKALVQIEYSESLCNDESTNRLRISHSGDNCKPHHNHHNHHSYCE